jgi:hypothetical protein
VRGDVCIEYLWPGSPFTNPIYEGRDEKFTQIGLESLSVPGHLSERAFRNATRSDSSCFESFKGWILSTTFRFSGGDMPSAGTGC